MFYKPARRKRAYLGIPGTTQMHLRSPYIVALWSAIFPGFGHLLLSKYLRGMILFIWEIFINLQSHLNLALFYTFTGNIEQARQVLDTRWIMLYLPTYLFAIWDSYKSTISINNNFKLAARENAPVKAFKINSMGCYYFEKGTPWIAIVWSLLSPGMGQLLDNRILIAFFLLVWWITVIFNSNVLPAIHYTMVGDFEMTKAVINPQWVLNIPSIMSFAAYDAYVNTVEGNKLFDWEQSRFLRNKYQNKQFNMPIGNKAGDQMYIVSNFEHSIKLELAITELETQGIKKEQILAVPLDKRTDTHKLFDSIHYTDGVSLIDVPIILAALCALFGMIYGFLMPWGPVLWTLIGCGTGFGVGLLGKLLIAKRKLNLQKNSKAKVVVMISCDCSQAQMVQRILWENDALGVGALK